MSEYYYLSTPDLRTSVGEHVPLEATWASVVGDRPRICTVRFAYNDAHGASSNTFTEVPAPLTEEECDALIGKLKTGQIRHLTFVKTPYDLPTFVDNKFPDKQVDPESIEPTLRELHQAED